MIGREVGGERFQGSREWIALFPSRAVSSVPIFSLLETVARDYSVAPERRPEGAFNISHSLPPRRAESSFFSPEIDVWEFILFRCTVREGERSFYEHLRAIVLTIACNWEGKICERRAAPECSALHFNGMKLFYPLAHVPGHAGTTSRIRRGTTSASIWKHLRSAPVRSFANSYLRLMTLKRCYWQIEQIVPYDKRYKVVR